MVDEIPVDCKWSGTFWQFGSSDQLCSELLHDVDDMLLYSNIEAVLVIMISNVEQTTTIDNFSCQCNIGGAANWSET